MDLAGKTAIVVAIITVVGGMAVALINIAPQILSRTPVPSSVVAACPPIPPSEENSPEPREGYMWFPADFRLTSSGELERQAGHWERARAEKHIYVPGHWDPSKERCVWIPGDFVLADG